ncbi:hypothetical protein BH10ACT2_BH10ACT2_28140 [soil metagenome]
MSFCGFCGTTIPTGAGFCGQCGRAISEPFVSPPVVQPGAVNPPLSAPITTVIPVVPTAPAASAFSAAPEPAVAMQSTPTAPANNGGLMALLALLGIIAVGGGVYLVTRTDDSKPRDTLTSTIAGATTVLGDESTAPSTIAIDPVQTATEQLQQFVAQDRPTADTLVGSWIPQLSAKRVGLQVGGTLYGPVEIVADHVPLRATYGAILVDAGAFQFTSGGSPMTGWFLSIVPEKFNSKAEAVKWCTDRGLGSNLCLARQFKPPNP